MRAHTVTILPWYCQESLGLAVAKRTAIWAIREVKSEATIDFPMCCCYLKLVGMLRWSYPLAGIFGPKSKFFRIWNGKMESVGHGWVLVPKRKVGMGLGDIGVVLVK